MKTFLFIFLAGYAVRHVDNYYVVERPDAIEPREFKVYWIVPTFQCTSKNIPFDNLFEKFGIIQNTGDNFDGDKSTILYDPGNFSAIKILDTGETWYRNGGIPQEGDVMLHLENFKREVEKRIPDKDFNGVGIIDFEDWRPIFERNFGENLQRYMNVSYYIETKKHWWWKTEWIKAEAKYRFERSARYFMESTIALAKKMRPKAVWGYYGFPICFNKPTHDNPENCVPGEAEKNDNMMYWLWSESTAIYPSVYVYDSQGVTPEKLALFIRGQVKEAARVALKGTPVLPFWSYRYRASKHPRFYTELELEASFKTFYNSDAAGFIIWDSSNNVNKKEKCIELYTYITETLGPALVKYTKPYIQRHGRTDENNVAKPEVVTEPPNNYTFNIEHIVDEEMNKLNTSGNKLIDIILNRVAYYCLHNNCDRTDGVKVTTESTVVVTIKEPNQETSTENEPTTTMTTEETNVKHESTYDSSGASTITTIDDDIETEGYTTNDRTVTSEPNDYSTIEINYTDLHITETFTEDSTTSEDSNTINIDFD